MRIRLPDIHIHQHKHKHQQPKLKPDNCYCGDIHKLSQDITNLTTLLTTLGESFMANMNQLREEIATWIVQAQTNHDLEMSAVVAIHNMLDKLDEQVNDGDLESIRQSVLVMRQSAGELAAAIASTGGTGETTTGGTGAEGGSQGPGEPIQPTEPVQEPGGSTTQPVEGIPDVPPELIPRDPGNS